MKITTAYLTPNEFSRPRIKMKKVKGIVIHYYANPMTTALANRNFFESRKDGLKGYGSAHENICLNGDVVLCVPMNEMAYNCGSPKPYMAEAIKRLSPYPNDCTYSIECAHVDTSGKMTPETYKTLVERTAHFCKLFELDPFKDVWLHKEVVGWKVCHKWFVDNPQEWKLFKERVAKMMKGDEHEMKVEDANKIIQYLKMAYAVAGDAERVEIGKLADSLRVASGQPTQNS